MEVEQRTSMELLQLQGSSTQSYGQTHTPVPCPLILAQVPHGTNFRKRLIWLTELLYSCYLQRWHKKDLCKKLHLRMICDIKIFQQLSSPRDKPHWLLQGSEVGIVLYNWLQNLEYLQAQKQKMVDNTDKDCYLPLNNYVSLGGHTAT